jgi:hypothetical protein
VDSPRNSGTSGRYDRTVELEGEARRYRDAAVLTLDQLEWCIDYLHGIGKTSIARAVAHNRKQIMRQAGMSQ